MSKHKPLPSRPAKVVKVYPWKAQYKIQGQLFPHYKKGTISKIDSAQKGGPSVTNTRNSNAKKKTSNTNKTQETKKTQKEKQVETKSQVKIDPKDARKQARLQKKIAKKAYKQEARKQKYFVDFDTFATTDLYKTLAQTGISIDQIKVVYMDLINNTSFKSKIRHLIQSKRVPQQILKALRKGNVAKLSKYTNDFTAVLDSATRKAKAEYKQNMAKVMPYAIAASLVASSLPDEDIL